MQRTIAALFLLSAPIFLAAEQSGALQPMSVTQFDGGSRPAQVAVPAAQPPQLPPVAPVVIPQPSLPAAPVIQLDERQGHPDLDLRRFSLSFAQPTPIRDILMLLVGDTNLSLIPDPALEQVFIGDLKNVTLREALDLILEPIGLDYSIRGNVIRVFVREFETRLYSVDRVITRRAGNRSMSASSGAAGGGAPAAGGGQAGGAAGGGGGGAGGSGGGGGSSTSVGGSDAPDLFGDLTTGIQNLISPDGKFNLDRTSALLQVTDRTSALDRIEQYLEASLLRAGRQVHIEARVIEVEMRDDFSAGINWNAVLGSLTNRVTVSQTAAPASAGGFTMALNIGDFSALLNAFATQGKVNVLSSPRVTAMNNEPAVMRIGTQDVFFTTTTQVNPETGQILQSTVTPNSITEGVVLSVTSQISADGLIHMSINPSITERTGQATSRLGDTVPIISVRETDTLLRVRSGETAVIAGLMQDRSSLDNVKMPIMGDLPFVGGLFKRTDRRRTKTDLVILITPTIIGPGQMAETVAKELRRLDTAQKAAGSKR